MSWIPIGPRFVFAPSDVAFKRLSRRNEQGAQALVARIAIEPGDPETIYVVIRPSTGGVGLYRSGKAGTPTEDWTSIVDPSQPNGLNGKIINPSCVAIDPVNPARIFMGTWDDQSIFVSSDRGESWGPGVGVGGRVRRLVIDPRTAGDPTHTVVYAATDQGLLRSVDSGLSWTSVPELKGLDVWSFCASMPPNGPDAYYAGALRSGLYTASDPTGPWTNLNAQNIGLPAYNAGAPGGENFNVVYADLCPLDPSRVYLLLLSGPIGDTTALYKTDSATSAWSKVTFGATVPSAYSAYSDFSSFYGIYDFAFAVAPNSPGKNAPGGNKDVLFFAGFSFWRSTDSGQTWVATANNLHVDHHDVVFSYPPNAQPGQMPSVYFGTDGGLGMSNHFCDPSVDISVKPPDYDELAVYSQGGSGAVQNYNHGISAVAIRDYTSHPAISAIQYIAANDTSIAAGEKTGAWRGFIVAALGASGDIANIAAAPGPDGVKVWYLPQGGLWPSSMFTDHRDFSPPTQPVQISSGQTVQTVTTSGTLVITPDNRCLCAMLVYGMQVIQKGVGLFDQNAKAWLISQDFSPSDAHVNLVSVGYASDIAYCGTCVSTSVGTSDYRVWWTPSVSAAATAAAANMTTMWTEVVNPPPGIVVQQIAIDASNAAYVLAESPMTVGGVTTPLFKVSGGAWEPQPCQNAPNLPGFEKPRLLADPTQAGVLYLSPGVPSSGGQVYRLTLMAGGTWNWQNISDDLPGQNIFQMWIGNIGGQINVLRVAIPERGVWELETSSPIGPLPISLYVRDNFLDQGLLPISPDFVPSPYAPTDPSQRAVHWMCADIKVDAQQNPGSGAFYQTDPEGAEGGTLPISAIAFDCINDNSTSLPTGDLARVHVQVHNRSLTPANDVLVWAIYAPAAGTPPALDSAFWSRFTVSGTGVAAINHAFASTSPWQSVGDPFPVSNIDAAHPKVASWQWAVPLLTSGGSGHYCVVAFVHSADAPLVGAGTNIDVIVPSNRQVGQKNLHVVGPMAVLQRGVGEYIEFNNPHASEEQFELIFDFRSLPKGFVADLQFTRREHAIAGAASSRTGTIVPVASPRQIEAAIAARRRVITLPQFADTIYTAHAPTRVVVSAVTIPPLGRVATYFTIATHQALRPGAKYWFMVTQHGRGRAVGGSTYVIRDA